MVSLADEEDKARLERRLGTVALVGSAWYATRTIKRLST